MTRKRRKHHSQMPTDPTRRAQIIALDELAKMPPVWNDDYLMKTEQARTERNARHNATQHVADIITQGDKQPKTWDEINSVTGAGGVSQLHKP